MSNKVKFGAVMVFICFWVYAAGFWGGSKYYELYKQPQAPTNLTVIEKVPDTPPVIEKKKEPVPACIYNDANGYKLIRFHNKGAQCWGIKRYGQSNIEAFWCEG